MNRRTEPVSRELAALRSRCVVNREWAEQDEGPYHREPLEPCTLGAAPRRR